MPANVIKVTHLGSYVTNERGELVRVQEKEAQLVRNEVAAERREIRQERKPPPRHRPIVGINYNPCGNIVEKSMRMAGTPHKTILRKAVGRRPRF